MIVLGFYAALFVASFLVVRLLRRRGARNDLTSRKTDLTFKQINDQGATYYIAQFPVQQPETYTFTVTVGAAGKTNSFSFNQEVFPGE